MNPAITSMLATYGKLNGIRDEENALKEIIQKICKPRPGKSQTQEFKRHGVLETTRREALG